MIIVPAWSLGSLEILENMNHVLAILARNLTVILLNGNDLVRGIGVGIYLKCITHTHC